MQAGLFFRGLFIGFFVFKELLLVSFSQQAMWELFGEPSVLLILSSMILSIFLHALFILAHFTFSPLKF